MKSYREKARDNMARWMLATIVCCILFLSNNAVIWFIINIGGALGILVGITAVGYWQNEYEISKRIDQIQSRKKRKENKTEFEIIHDVSKTES